jgi:hypothetical protein
MVCLQEFVQTFILREVTLLVDLRFGEGEDFISPEAGIQMPRES